MDFCDLSYLHEASLLWSMERMGFHYVNEEEWWRRVGEWMDFCDFSCLHGASLLWLMTERMGFHGVNEGKWREWEWVNLCLSYQH